jgi:hypothetical protein
MFFVIGTRSTGHQQQVEGLGRVVNMAVGLHLHAIGRPQHPVLGANGRQ